MINLWKVTQHIGGSAFFSLPAGTRTSSCTRHLSRPALSIPASMASHWPRGRCRLSRLPLDPRAPHDVVLHGHLDLCGDVWRCVADLHCCLQETYGTHVLELVCHVLFIAVCLALQDGQVRRNGLVSPGNPAQLPKEKQKNCHQGQSTHNNYHCKEADGELYSGREGNREKRQGEGKNGKGEKKRKMVRKP